MKLIVLVMILIVFSLTVSIHGKDNCVPVRDYNGCVDENNRCAELLISCDETMKDCGKLLEKKCDPTIKDYTLSGGIGFILGIILMLIL